VIKSYSEEDIHKSMKYQVWSSTIEGNKRLNEAYKQASSEKIPFFLFFSANGSGQFVGVAKMASPVSFSEKLAHWEVKGKWLGKFKVEWIFIKDIENKEFRHIMVESLNKPVTNLRDAQEIPYDAGMQMLKIFKEYTPQTTILDEFEYYDNDELLKKQEFEQFKKSTQFQPKMRKFRGKKAAMEKIIPVEGEQGIKAIIPISAEFYKPPALKKSSSEYKPKTYEVYDEFDPNNL